MDVQQTPPPCNSVALQLQLQQADTLIAELASLLSQVAGSDIESISRYQQQLGSLAQSYQDLASLLSVLNQDGDWRYA